MNFVRDQAQRLDKKRKLCPARRERVPREGILYLGSDTTAQYWSIFFFGKISGWMADPAQLHFLLGRRRPSGPQVSFGRRTRVSLSFMEKKCKLLLSARREGTITSPLLATHQGTGSGEPDQSRQRRFWVCLGEDGSNLGERWCRNGSVTLAKRIAATKASR